MSDAKKPEKAKRGYKVGGEALACDLRVRLDAATAAQLAETAKRKKTTRAAIARQILQDALKPDET